MKNRVWTRETITEVLKQCRSMNQLKEKYSGAYDAMKRNGWSDLKIHINRNLAVQDNSLKWSPEYLLELTKECGSIKEFRHKYPRAYEKIKDKKWDYLFDDLRLHSRPIKLTRERISRYIARCSTLYEFRTEYRSAYYAMVRNGWQDLCDHLPRTLHPEASGNNWCVYRWYFPERNTVYVGLSKNYDKRIKDELRYRSASPVKDFIDSTGCTYEVKQVYSGLNSDDAARLEVATIQDSIVNGYSVLNRNRGGTLGGNRAEPSIARIYIIAKYDKAGVYIGSVKLDERREVVENEAMNMELSGECSKTEVIPVEIPWRQVDPEEVK